MQLCRRRSEEVCWTTWAVATPGAEGVGRLPCRSKWGRYRPKNGFLTRPFLRSVAGYLDSFLAPSGLNCWKTGSTPGQKLPRYVSLSQNAYLSAVLLVPASLRNRL